MDAGDRKLEVNPIWGEFGMSAPIRVATVLTSHAEMAKDEPTGAWFEEIAKPYYAFVDGDARVEILSIPGSPTWAASVAAIKAAAIYDRNRDPRDINRFEEDRFTALFGPEQSQRMHAFLVGQREPAQP